MNKTQLELLVDKLTKENRALEDNVIRLFKNVSTLENTVSKLEYYNNDLTITKDKYKELCGVKNIEISTLEDTISTLQNNYINLQDEYEDSLLNIELLNKEIATLQENDLDDLYLASLDEIQKLNLKILKLKKKNRKLKK